MKPQPDQTKSMELKIKLNQIDNDIRARLEAARLPTFPSTFLKLMEQCQSDVVGFAEILHLVEQDAGMVAKILGLANSSAYSRGTPIATLERAMQFIGTEMIKIIVINESVSQVFDKMSQSLGADLSHFWAHSLQTGVAARMLAQTTGYANVEEAYLSGLLHDVGRLALLTVMPQQYKGHFHRIDNDDLCGFEKLTLHTDHAEVGSWLVNLWKLDSFIAQAVQYHHEAPVRLLSAHPLIRITHLAHVIASDVEGDELELSGELCSLGASELEDIRSASWEQTLKAAQEMNISLANDPVAAVQVLAPVDPFQEKLVRQVNGMMLNSALERAFNRQEQESDLQELVIRSAGILFNFNTCVLLLMNNAGNALTACQSGTHRLPLADFSVALALERSAIAQAARSRTIAFTSPGNPDMNALESQSLGLLDTDQIVCLPLLVEGTCLGVLVGGFKVWQLDDLKKRQNFLLAFSAQAALSLQSMNLEKNRLEQQSENLARDYRHASRKVAHEVNNPLSIIKNYLSILDRKLQKMQMASGEVGILNEEIDRVAKIINDFAEINLIETGHKIELAGVIEDVVRLFRQTEFISSTLQLDWRQKDLCRNVLGSADVLKQIFVNLIKNAVEAMNGVGRIEIGSDGEVCRDGISYVNVWILDTGPGIAPEIMSQLFLPVRSTKGNGHSGLGLNIVYGLVKRLHGDISCQSTANGTKFDVLLPAA